MQSEACQTPRDTRLSPARISLCSVCVRAIMPAMKLHGWTIEPARRLVAQGRDVGVIVDHQDRTIRFTGTCDRLALACACVSAALSTSATTFAPPKRESNASTIAFTRYTSGSGTEIVRR